MNPTPNDTPQVGLLCAIYEDHTSGFGRFVQSGWCLNDTTVVTAGHGIEGEKTYRVKICGVRGQPPDGIVARPVEVEFAEDHTHRDYAILELEVPKGVLSGLSLPTGATELNHHGRFYTGSRAVLPSFQKNSHVYPFDLEGKMGPPSVPTTPSEFLLRMDPDNAAFCEGMSGAPVVIQHPYVRSRDRVYLLLGHLKGYINGGQNGMIYPIQRISIGAERLHAASPVLGLMFESLDVHELVIDVMSRGELAWSALGNEHSCLQVRTPDDLCREVQDLSLIGGTISKRLLTARAAVAFARHGRSSLVAFVYVRHVPSNRHHRALLRKVVAKTRLTQNSWNLVAVSQELLSCLHECAEKVVVRVFRLPHLVHDSEVIPVRGNGYVGRA